MNIQQTKTMNADK